MREILFRAKCSRTNEWVFGYLSNKDVINTDRVRLKVHKDTIGQYTGLTDKNGVKIFEGDKVLYDGIIGIVSYDNVMFMVRFEYTRSRLALGELDRDLEVIGNMHDD